MSDSSPLAPLRRRWYVVVLGLLVTGVLAYASTLGAAPTYTKTASVLLMPGKRTIPPGGNPFQHLGDLTQARDVLVQSLSTRTATEAILGSPSGGVLVGSVAVTPDNETTGPMILLSGSAATSQRAADLVKALQDALQKRLKSLQDESATPPGARISALLVSEDERVDTGGKQAIRILIVLSAIGLAVTLLLTAVIDAVLLSRRSRQVASEVDSAEAPSEGDSRERGPHDSEAAVQESQPRDPSAPDLDAPLDHERAAEEWDVKT